VIPCILYPYLGQGLASAKGDKRLVPRLPNNTELIVLVVRYGCGIYDRGIIQAKISTYKGQPSVPCQAVFLNNYNYPCHNWDISTKILLFFYDNVFFFFDNMSPVLETGSCQPDVKVSALWKMIL